MLASMLWPCAVLMSLGGRRLKTGAKTWHRHQAESPDSHWSLANLRPDHITSPGEQRKLGGSISGINVPQLSGKSFYGCFGSKV